MTVVLYGPAYSTYVRTVRLVLEEKAVAYDLREVDLLKGEGQRPEHKARHPFGKAPVLEHDGFALFETVAIARYVDEAFPGPRLQPEGVRERARMTQIVAVIDHYLYGPLVTRLLMQALFAPLMGRAPDQGVVAEARPAVEHALGVLEDLGGDGQLAGAGFGLADCHLVPILDYFVQTGDGSAALARHPRLAAWWRRVGERPSVAETRPRFG